MPQRGDVCQTQEQMHRRVEMGSEWQPRFVQEVQAHHVDDAASAASEVVAGVEDRRSSRDPELAEMPMRRLVLGATAALLLAACGHSDPLDAYIRSIPDCQTLSEASLEVRVVFDPQTYPQHILDPAKSPSRDHWVQNWPEVWSHLQEAMNHSEMTQAQISDAMTKRKDEPGC